MEQRLTAWRVVARSGRAVATEVGTALGTLGVQQNYSIYLAVQRGDSLKVQLEQLRRCDFPCSQRCDHLGRRHHRGCVAVHHDTAYKLYIKI